MFYKTYRKNSSEFYSENRVKELNRLAKSEVTEAPEAKPPGGGSGKESTL